MQERREELKQQMAVTASRLLQNPEANLPTMRSLLTLATDKDSQVNFYGVTVCLLVLRSRLYCTPDCDDCKVCDHTHVLYACCWFHAYTWT